MRNGTLLLVLVGCGGGEDGTSAPDYSAYPLAGDVVIDKVTWYQGVEKVLYLGPGVFGGGSRPPPILTGRDAMLRVAVSAYDEENPRTRDVAVVLNYDWGPHAVTVTQVISSSGWQEPVLGSTAAFTIPGEFVTGDIAFDVSVHELTPTSTGGYVDEAVWSSATATPPLDMEATDYEKLVIVPVQYGADGSGRVPDTSPARIAEITARYRAMFPVVDVVVEVKPPIAWNSVIGAFSGWEGLLAEISRIRDAANEPPSTYYYGLFEPAATFEQYCTMGCILGLSNLAFNTTDEWMRASIGLGYEEYVVDTLLHEVGHAHGREHAPCSLGSQPSDPGYPYGNARLGSWGYDVNTSELVDPQLHADVMSYCYPMWVSDYTFGALHDRIVALGGQARGPKATWQRLLVGADGTAHPHGTLRAGVAPADHEVELEWLDEAGEVTGTGTGWFVPYDHLDGGVLLVRELGGASARLLDQ